MTIEPHGPYTLGWLLAMPFGLAVALVAFVVLVGATVAWAQGRGSYDNSGPAILAVIAAIGLAGALTITLLASWPFDTAYHQYRKVHGQVASVNSRLLDQTTKYVVIFEGSGQPFGVSDTRMAAVRAGDTLTLNCLKQWDYGSTAGYDCKWVSAP